MILKEPSVINKIQIMYCCQCRWLMRSSWMAQELLSTFSQEINELTLRPSSGGVFEIIANDTVVWSRKINGGFPEITELKQRVRDVIAPEKNLGCIDNKKPKI